MLNIMMLSQHIFENCGDEVPQVIVISKILQLHLFFA